MSRRAFTIAVVALLGIIAANGLRNPGAFWGLLRGLLHVNSVLEPERWQRWVDENPSFFGALQPGATVGLVPTLDAGVGLVFDKQAQGMRVRKTYAMTGEAPGVLLTMTADAAEEALGLSQARDGVQFWNTLKALAAQGHIGVYFRGEPEILAKQGYLRFLSDSLNAKPPTTGADRKGTKRSGERQ